MATAATHTPIHIMPKPIENSRDRIDFKEGTTWIQHQVKALCYVLNESYFSDNTILLQNTSKAFVNHLRNVIKEYELLRDYFPNVSQQNLINKLQPSLLSFVKMDSDILSVELSKDETIFFTMKKNEFVFYIEQYLEDVIDEEEFVLTAFRKNNITINRSGSLSKIVSTMNSLSVNN